MNAITSITPQGQTITVPDGTTNIFDVLRKTSFWPEISNVEAEAAFLGGLMINNDAVNQFRHVEPDAFFDSVHRRIYKRILQLIDRGQAANPVTLRPLFEDDEGMRQIGGPGYLAQLTGSNAALIGSRSLADQIVELWQRRLMFSALVASAEACAHDWDHDGVQHIVDAVDEATSLVAVRTTENRTVAFARAWDQALERYDDIEAGRIDPGIKIDGLPDFNDLTGGLKSGHLIIVAGRPSMGKTALALTLLNSTARAGHGVAFMSLEMSREELLERQMTDICFEHGRSFTYQSLKKGKLSPYQRQQVANMGNAVRDWPIYIDDTADLKVGHLVGKLRRIKKAMAKKGIPLKVAIIDYLQLLRADNDYRGNKVAEVSEISRALKVAAKELGITIIALSQLSRAVESREDKRPMLSDLRESGAIEQDADAVLFVFREEYYLERSEPKKADNAKAIKEWDDWNISYQASRDRMDLIAAKVRGGRMGIRKCYFFGDHQAVRGADFFKDQSYDG